MSSVNATGDQNNVNYAKIKNFTYYGDKNLQEKKPYAAYVNFWKAAQLTRPGCITPACATALEALRMQNEALPCNDNAKKAWQIQKLIGYGTLSLNNDPYLAYITFNHAAQSSPSPVTYTACAAALNALGRQGKPLTILGPADTLPRALEACNTALKCNETFPDAHYERGEALRLLGHHTDAQKAYNRAIELRAQIDNEEFPAAHYGLGLILTDQKQPRRAILAFTKALNIEPFPAAYYERGAAFLILGKHSKALADFDAALNLRQDFPEAHCERGEALLGLGRLPEARAAFEEALRLRENFPEAHAGLGLCLRFSGETSKALEAFGKALKIKPFRQAYYERGVTFLSLKQYAAALTDFNAALKIKENFPEAHCGRGEALLGLVNLKETRKAFEQALHYKKDCPEAHAGLFKVLQAHYERGKILLKSGRHYSAALADFDEILKSNKAYYRAHCGRGEALLGLVDLKEARKAFEQALHYKKDCPEALAGLAQISLKENKNVV